MNRPRREKEPYKDYKADLKAEEAKLKKYLKGRLTWISSMIMPDPDDKDKMPLLRRLIKLPVRGTFCRALGHEQRTSLVDKERKAKILKALQKQGII